MFGLPSFRIFTLLRVDVSISMSYLLLVGLCIYWYGPARGLIAAFAMTLSIIIHEFGHALVCRRYELEPSIVLHGLGGLCYHTPASTDKREVLITLAGPLLQILAGGVALAIMFAAGTLGSFTGVLTQGMGGSLASVGYFFVTIFASFSIFWGLLNLVLPVWPLDGGKLFVLLLRRFMSEESAAKWGLRISLFTLAPLGALALWAQSILLGYIIVSMALQDFQLLQSGAPLFAHPSGRRPRRRATAFTKELLEQSRQHFADEDWRESARLCHQLRAAGDPIPEEMGDEIWTILGLCATKQGEWEEALGWLKRAPQTEEVVQATLLCKKQLSEQDA